MKDASLENKKNVYLLFFFHIVVGVIYYYYSLNNSADAIGYWRIPKFLSEQDIINYLKTGKGTVFMYVINYIPSNVLELSYFEGTILYTLLGFLGVLFFYRITIDLVPYNIQYKNIYLFPFLFFLPNLHFWSVAVGKDTLLFFSIGIIAYGILNIKRRLLLILIGAFLSFIVRPHVALFLGISFGIAYLISGNVSKKQRVFFTILILGTTIAILPIVMEYVKIDDMSLNSIESFSGTQAENLSDSNTGSSVDISSYPYPLKVLTFLYRPFFFDISSLPSLVASFENLLLLVLSVQVLKSKPVQTFRAAPLVIQALLIFLAIGTLAFSMSLGNLGIMLRMRNMLLPGMLIFILWSFSYKEQQLRKNNDNG